MESKEIRLQDLPQFAADFITQLQSSASAEGSSIAQHATIVRLVGDLGAGKTAFTKTVAAELGITETITSPTFVIEKIYPISTDSTGNPKNKKPLHPWDKLVHIDAYRLKNAAELEALHWHDVVGDPKALVLIEWPELVEGAAGIAADEATAEICFEVINETTRKVSWQIISTTK